MHFGGRGDAHEAGASFMEMSEMMNSVEVTHISNRGIWPLVMEKEYLLEFERFPWFLKASVSQIHDVKLSHGKYIHWPKLVVDLELESLGRPEGYPLVFKN